MITQLAFLDLAAKACPRRVEATLFALLMAVFNAGNQSSQMVGGHLYDWQGYTALVLISTAFTAVTWFLVSLVSIDRTRTAECAPSAAGPRLPASPGTRTLRADAA